MKILVLVESPAKVKKISGILNGQKDGNQYIVAPTVGHILALNKDKTIGVDLGNNYRPDYIEHPGKGDVIANLRRLKKQCAAVWIASDLDQEGEFIGFSICEILGLPAVTTPRIVFNEITKDAILRAVNNPGRLDFDLIDAQKCRRITDRLIGFLITRAAKTINDKLTVGRVQTIMVKLVVDREEEMKNFQKTLSFHTNGRFDTEHGPIEAKLNKTFAGLQPCREFLEKCHDCQRFVIESLVDKIVKKNPPPPLITSTLQSLVSRSLGISPKAVLDVAQRLYQQGVISYPRTDCPKLPEEKMKECEEFIVDKYGNEYHQERFFKNNDQSAQEAHACIYPTRIEMDCLVDDEDIEWSNREKRVYHYVWLYTVSSQMKPSETKNTKAKIALSDQSITERFVADHNQLVFEGYLKAWGKIAVAEEGDDGSDSGDENESKNSALVKLKEGNLVEVNHIQSQQKAAQGPSPYTESALLTQMKKLGIGRPSTYGKILQDIQGNEKRFIYKGNKTGEKMKIMILNWKPKISDEIMEDSKEITQNAYRNRLYSTELGVAIHDFADQFFPNVFNYHFTGDLEKKMGQIESGKVQWHRVVDDLYREFAPKLKQFPTYRTREDGPNPARKAKRMVGEYQNQPVFAYLAKYGPVIQIGSDDENPRFIKLPKEYRVDQVEMNEIQELLRFPYHLGKLRDGRPAILKRSDYGLYIDTEETLGHKRKTYQVVEKMFEDFDDTVPIMGQIDQLRLDLVNASIEETEKPKDVLRDIKDIRILNGKYGPYFIFNRTLVGIPKFHNVDLLTYDECLQLYRSKLAKSGSRKGGGTKKKIILRKKL